MNKTDLVDAVDGLVKKKWEKDRSPLLTSNIGTLLAQDAVDYKLILEGGNLTDFLRMHASKFKVVVHPSQRAKIGVIPSSEDYLFDDPVADALAESRDGSNAIDFTDITLKKSRGAFYSFVRAVSDLSKEEIASVHIPMNVIVKLLEGK
jgi:hypothetical protein